MDQYKLAIDSAVGERRLSGTVLYKEEGLIRVAVIMTMIKESDVKEVQRDNFNLNEDYYF